RDAADAELRGDAAAAVAAGRHCGADPPGGPAAGDRGRGVGAGAGLARGGEMLLHASLAGAGAGTVLAAAGGEPQDVALLTAVSMCFALGAATTEQFKHLAAAEAGPLAGLGALPGLRALRPELARIADGTDPLRLQQMLASAM